MRINFILPPCELSGGPLAILEYANRFALRGHEVSVTTYPTMYWPISWNRKAEPYPWFKDFHGRYVYKKTSSIAQNLYRLTRKICMCYGGEERKSRLAGFAQLFDIQAICKAMIGYMPDCDINIATLWSSVFAAYFSQKGKPVYFMQHYEEIFYPLDYSALLQRLLARMSYEMPIYKIANSSWLQSVIREKYAQEVPFSNNATQLSEFAPRPKPSVSDGIIRIMTFSRPEEWKGFADVAQAMALVKHKHGDHIEWQVFGREHPYIKSNNATCPFTLYERIPFSKLAQLYAECDITVCGSWYESFPLPPLEAMASGTAVITTVYGVEDYCRHEENCLLVAPRDVNGIAKAIERLIEDKGLREQLAAAGLKTAAKYNWDAAVDARERLLYDIVDGKVDYDRYAPLSVGLKDFADVAFERMPVDMTNAYPEGTLIRCNGMVFLIKNGAKQHVATEDILKRCISPDTKINDIPLIDFARIPLGFPVLTENDL